MGAGLVMEQTRREELIKKYQWAGKIRFVSFGLLFVFLLLMKVIGGYSYLSITLASLIFVEAILNQPYRFLLKRADLYRFQFYQMTTDIIAISWVLYYMGGIEAPVINLAYYAVILWAGVVSGVGAVFFAVSASCLLFSVIVILAHFRILPYVTYLNYDISSPQLFSLLFGNIAFLFAFGYFSGYSSIIVKFIEKKRQEEGLKYTHRFLATGYLLSAIVHDIVNHLAAVRNYATILLEKTKKGIPEHKGFDSTEALKAIEKLELENIELLSKLSRFSRKQKEKQQPTDLNKVIEDTLGLILPLARMSDIVVETRYEQNLPLVAIDTDQMQEALVILLLNSLEDMPKKGNITIKTLFLKEENFVQVVLSDTGSRSLKQDYLKRISEPFFDSNNHKEEGSSFRIAYEILARHRARLNIEVLAGKGTTTIIQLPAA